MRKSKEDEKPIEHELLNEKNATPENIVHDIECQLMAIYEMTICNGGFHEFLECYRLTLAADSSISERSIVLAFAEKAKGMTGANLIGIERLKTSIKMTIFFCEKVKATASLIEQWYFVTQASRWLGASLGTEHAFYEVTGVGKKFSKSGGSGKSDIYLPLRDLAIDLAKKREYPSRRNAALSIKTEILAEAKNRNIYLSEQQAEKTITKWLSNIPFAGKRGTRAGTSPTRTST